MHHVEETQAQPGIYDMTIYAHMNLGMAGWIARHLCLQLRRLSLDDINMTTVMTDMAGWIARHPSSPLRRLSLGDINITSLKRYLGLCLNTGILRKKNVPWNWSKQ